MKRRIILMLDNSRAADRGLIRGIVSYANLRDNWTFHRCSPRFWGFPFSSEKTEDLLDRLLNLDADGLIGYLPQDHCLREKIIEKKFPAVTIPIDTINEGIINIQQDAKTGIKAAEYLLGLGVTNFGFSGLPHYWSRVRQENFIETIRQHGHQVSVAPEPTKCSREQDMSKLIDWLNNLEYPCAIMACNDERSADLAEACLLADLAIPSQIAILGVDDDEMICKLNTPPLSSIQMNFEAVGYHAAEVIDHILNHRPYDLTDLIFCPTEIIARQSTDILKITDTEVADAIRFIRNNARRAITVSDVLANSTLSLRSLQLRFRKAIKRSITQEIRRVRVEEMARMLINTNQTIQQIAYAMEFEDINHISRIFSKEMGLTPKEFRRQFGGK